MRGGTSRASDDALRTAGRLAGRYLGLPAGSPAVGVGHRLTEGGHLLDVNQVDGSAAEPSAGHASRPQTRGGAGQVDHQVQLAAAHLVVIAQAAV